MISFPWNTHNEHLLAYLLRWDMWCLMWVPKNGLYSALITALIFAMSCKTGLYDNKVPVRYNKMVFLNYYLGSANG